MPTKKQLKVQSIPEIFRRAGHAFNNKEPKYLDLDELTEDQVAALKDEKKLVVTEVETEITQEEADAAKEEAAAGKKEKKKKG